MVDTWMCIHCNAGVMRKNQVGDLRGFGKVWYHPNLLMAVVEKYFRVPYAGATDEEFTVIKQDVSSMKFWRSLRGRTVL